MKIVVAPNSFRDNLSSELVSACLIEGIRRVAPDASIVDLPLADGGDGTLSCLQRLLGGNFHVTGVQDTRGKPVDAKFAITSNRKTAIIEMAEASGSRLVPFDERDPFHFSTYGTGQLILAALDLGVESVIMGIGGSGTIDGGAGALAAIGAKFLDANGSILKPTPYGLRTMSQIDTTGMDTRLNNIQMTILCDVQTRYDQCLRRFGPQKGVKHSDVDEMELVLSKIAMLADARGFKIMSLPWLGAGGGLAGGLAAFAHAQIVGGAEYLCKLAKVESHLQNTELLLTGEGKFDHGSFQGKLPLTVARLASNNMVRAVIIAGQIVESDLEELPNLVSLFNLAQSRTTLNEMMADLPLKLLSAGESIARSIL